MTGEDKHNTDGGVQLAAVCSVDAESNSRSATDSGGTNSIYVGLILEEGYEEGFLLVCCLLFSFDERIASVVP